MRGDVLSIRRARRALVSGALKTGLLVLPAILSAGPMQAQTFSVLYTFMGHGDGATPVASLIADTAGNLYGATNGGHSGQCVGGCGTVFKLDPTGHETLLYTFPGGASAQNPDAGVIRDNTGNLYGTAGGGSTGYAGVVYKLDPAGHETVPHNFTGGVDGAEPYSGLLRDRDGNLYGTTFGGGSSGFGVVFQLDPAGNETVLYSFKGGADGSGPSAGLIMDEAGNLYGTTYLGGELSACPTEGCGVVFKPDLAGNETVLYTFKGTGDGKFPSATLTRDPEGNLYGTTPEGGSSSKACQPNSCGVIFKVEPAGNETVLYASQEEWTVGFLRAASFAIRQAISTARPETEVFCPVTSVPYSVDVEVYSC